MEVMRGKRAKELRPTLEVGVTGLGSGELKETMEDKARSLALASG